MGVEIELLAFITSALHEDAVSFTYWPLYPRRNETSVPTEQKVG
jgi:hypothetical protein